jgi:hypothetical protein
MTPDDLKKGLELAEKLKDTSVALLIVLVVAVCFMINLGNYLKTKAANAATREDFEVLKRQAAAQTEATKKIEATISHGTWVKQQWLTIRRTKLEELVAAALELRRIARKDAEKLGR